MKEPYNKTLERLLPGLKRTTNDPEEREAELKEERPLTDILSEGGRKRTLEMLTEFFHDIQPRMSELGERYGF